MTFIVVMFTFCRTFHQVHLGIDRLNAVVGATSNPIGISQHAADVGRHDAAHFRYTQYTVSQLIRKL